MSKIYAVRIGRNPGTYDSWEECEAQVKGFKGAVYKKCDSIQEANDFIKSESTDEPVANKAIDNINDEEIKDYIRRGYIVAFTDGSYSEEEKAYTYGLVVINNENLKYDTSYAKRDNPIYLESRNVSGEVFAVIEAIQYAIAHKYDKLLICHDYEGVSKWISKEWNTKTEISKVLVKIYDKYCDIIDIEFRKIKAHSGNKFNELADKLAEQAYSNKRKTSLKHGDNYVVFNNIQEEQFEKIFMNISTETHQIRIEDKSDDKKRLYVLSYDNERLFLSYFNTARKTLMIQGNQQKLFFILLDNILTNSDENIRTVLSEVFKISVNEKRLKDKYDILLNNLPETFNSAFKKLIYTSIQILDITYSVFTDQGHFIIPIMRVLEGVLKKKLIDNGIMTIEKQQRFKVFKEISGSYYLENTGSLSTNDVNKIEAAYNFYADQRHSISHSGDYIGADLFSVREIPSLEEAKNVIREAINQINILHS
ncbi:MAG: viroplasmin family protein [Acholeplasma sp.]|nr:viroplasmin family protein [Acholeplasma sp.]